MLLNFFFGTNFYKLTCKGTRDKLACSTIITHGSEDLQDPENGLKLTLTNCDKAQGFAHSKSPVGCPAWGVGEGGEKGGGGGVVLEPYHN